MSNDDRHSGCVILWDGRAYSTEAVNAEVANLSQYAIQHPQLTERMPDIGWRFALAIFYAAIRAGALLFAVLLVLVELAALPQGQGWVAVPIIALVVLALSAIVALGTLCDFSSYRPTVVVASGRITVANQLDRIERQLRDCRWWIGTLSQMHLTRSNYIPLNDPVILIDLGTRPRFHPGYVVAVGYTPEMRAIWQAFLRLAEVPARDSAMRPQREAVDT